MNDLYLPSDRSEDSGDPGAGLYTIPTWEQEYLIKRGIEPTPVIVNAAPDIDEFMLENWMLFEETLRGPLVLVGTQENCKPIADYILKSFHIPCRITKGRVIVSRHAAAVEWLKQLGIDGDFYEHIDDPDIVTGTIAYGTLPYHLARLTEYYFSIDMEVPKEYRGKELTIDDMKSFGVRLNRYTIR